ncbi:MAG: cobyrinate a,c-diamide synthase [Lachnospiraceae bacterium]|nr:cobyrinate a,c-diamide synthase [Lachnospiraceae bacterium]
MTMMENEKYENSIPRILIAAEKSGCGKTTFTCGFLQLLLKRGYRPLSFKCGPDYIDPMFHERVLGIPGNNLDTFFQGADGTREVLAESFALNENKEDGREEENAAGHEFNAAVIEGVMGIYDGLSPFSPEGSCYEIADSTKTPVLLLVDAKGVGRTLISRIKGILSEDGNRRIRGVVLNRVGAGFYERIKPVLEVELCRFGYDVKVLGFMPENEEIVLDSRHLGLMLPGEIKELKEKNGLIADMIEKNCDVDGILAIMSDGAKPDPKRTAETDLKSPAAPDSQNLRDFSINQCGSISVNPMLTLAVAKDEAFCFYYRENLKLFEKMGVKIKYFSPVHDTEIPKDADAVLFGGGYPENYAKELSDNKSMLESVRLAIESGMPSLAECGGFMYLHKEIKNREGNVYPMAGVIDATAEYTGHSVRFGYLEVTECKKPYFKSLQGILGHEFHYFDSSNNGTDCILVKASTKKEYASLIVKENSVWGFAHFYYGSNRGFIREFVQRMRDFHESCGKAVSTANVSKAGARFFSNHDCEYYPCHKCSAELNCLFCFCPLYYYDCPGSYTMIESGGRLKKNCKDCVYPHLAQNYEKIMAVLKEKSPDFPT